jgi:dTDP-4-amino-4,6-dideoxygalactose transaminase
MSPESEFFPLATSSWGEEEELAIQSVVDSGRFTMGPRVAEFEQVFAEYFGQNVNGGAKTCQRAA